VEVFMKRFSYQILGCIVSLIVVIGGGLAASRSSARDEAIRFSRGPNGEILFSNSEIALRFDDQMGLHVAKKLEGKGLKYLASSSGPSHFIVSDGEEIKVFLLDRSRIRLREITTEFGLGKRLTLLGIGQTTKGAKVELTLFVDLYRKYGDTAIITASYENLSGRNIKVDREIASALTLDASLLNPGSAPYDFWSFQGSSINWGKDEFIKLKPGFDQENYTGINRTSDYAAGGGLPFIDLWTPAAGLALAHVEETPKLLSLPVQVDSDGKTHISVLVKPDKVLKPRQSYTGPKLMLTVHTGDFAQPLARYSQLLKAQGWKPAVPNKEAYEATWCGWGYEFNFKPQEMLGVIPKLKELGVHWATIDDRWFVNYGDWKPREDIFPGGVRGIKDMVDEFHRQGVLTQLWWYPLVAEAGQGKYWSHTFTTSDVVQQHPEWLIEDEKGQHPLLFRDLPVLCPAVPGVQQYTRDLTRRFIKDWGFDGLKLDVVYSVPPCYNKKHHHRSPEDSVRAMGRIYRTIYETALDIKPNAVVQICPCGTPPFFPWAPYMNQAVTADPVGAWQVRSRIKMYKALLGPRAAVYADHIELSGYTHDDQGRLFNGEDFASAIGAGGVIGTRFIWPAASRKDSSGRETLKPDEQRNMKAILLGGEREQTFKKWFRIYNQKKLSAGEYLNLYDIVYDKPETHAISKNGKMYYAFYAESPDQEWRGEVQLRGFGAGTYRVYDYVADKVLAEVQGPNPTLPIAFKGSLLIEVATASGKITRQR
jgi:alpha-galactosidase